MGLVNCPICRGFGTASGGGTCLECAGTGAMRAASRRELLQALPGMSYYDRALRTAIRAFQRTHRAYFARLDLLTADHDNQMYHLGRALGHAAIRRDPSLAPGESFRY